MKFPDVGGGRSDGKSGGTFLKLKDGDRATGVFRGDPHVYRQHWVGGRSAICPGKDTCEHCKSGDKPKFRFSINFLTKEDGVWIAKIFQQGYGMFKDLKEMHENAYELPETCVIVSRSGEGTDTRYRVMPAKNNGGLKHVDFAALAKVPLNVLSDEEPAAEDESDANGDVPF